MRRSTTTRTLSGLRELALTPLIALELLTILRLRRPSVVADALFGRSQAWFPAVGLLIGGLAYAFHLLAVDLFSGSLSGWLTAGLIVFITGAFHLDGLGDSADGLFGGRSAAERLTIMRDSALGTYGVCAIVLVLALKAAAIASLDADVRLEALLLAPCLARWAAVVMIAAFPYARAAGLGQSFNAHAFPWPAPLAATVAILAALLLSDWVGVALFLGAAAFALGLGVFIRGKIDGVTGDSYGAVVEVTEVGALLAFAAGAP